MPKLLKTLKDLKPAQYNPRSITPEALSGLGYSLQEFGDLSGIVFNTQTGNLVCGHQRVKALQEKYGNAAIINNAIKANGHAFPIRLVEWPYQKELAANIAANSPTIQGDFTEELNALLEEIQIENPVLYDTLHLEDLQLETEPEEYHGQTDPDELPEQSATETRCKPGDLWQLGRHRLLCGDAINADDVERLMGGKKADMVFTDPPYNVGINYSQEINDSKTPEEYIQWSKDWFFLMQEIVSENIVFTPGAFNLCIWYGIENPKWQLVWVKKNQNSRNGAGGFNAYEPILVYGKVKVPYDVFDIPVAQQNDIEDHPMPKLFKAWKEILDSLCIGDNIADPFLGSGTTLIAAEKTARTCYGMEINPHYCDVILQRWENFTGEKAKRVKK